MPASLRSVTGLSTTRLYTCLGGQWLRKLLLGMKMYMVSPSVGKQTGLLAGFGGM
jgi:hypothetical protein